MTITVAVFIALALGLIFVSYSCGYIVGHTKCYEEFKIYKNIVEHDIKYGKIKWKNGKNK